MDIPEHAQFWNSENFENFEILNLKKNWNFFNFLKIKKFWKFENFGMEN
jgi:hypothetical protein